MNQLPACIILRHHYRDMAGAAAQWSGMQDNEFIDGYPLPIIGNHIFGWSE
ncbi:MULTISPECIES: hypothetical protein [Citrobacter]|uniref:hypothetical protein n=1 Tax=Citrobacter TaxID=544 RepID=UPI00148581DA|nr:MULTISPECIES: hypothetical protein [Citrobacter]WFY32081.1 hypothetical protein NFK28_04200 [Citrobacter braakii]